MKENQEQGNLAATPPERVHPMQVRTNLRGGESVEACMSNLKYWQDEYYKWYEQAKYKSV